MSRLRPRWPTLPPRLVADLLAGHSAVALALGALIHLVCLTGTLCVFMGELQSLEAPWPPPAAFDPADSDRLVADALRLAGAPGRASTLGKARFVVLRAPSPPLRRTLVSVDRRKWTPGAGGRLVPIDLPWTEFLEALHIDLTLPGPWGELAVGLLGMALFSLLLTGVAAHPRILKDAFLLRLGGGRRLQEADLHNRLGVWGLPFHLAVTLSGAFFALASLGVFAVEALGRPAEAARLTGAFQPPPAAADPRPAPLPPLARVVEEARALRPGSQLYYFSVAAPGTRGERTSVEVTAPGRLPRGETAYFDGSAGRLVARGRFASGDVGMQLYSGAVQVHFGFFGGLPVRLAYGLLGLALTWICACGTSIWLARRRDAGRHAPRLEHAWSAWVWGSPLALALAALPVPLAPTAVFWTSALAGPALSQLPAVCAWTQARFDRLCRLTLALGLAASGLARLAPALHSGAALAVEAAMLATAAGLAVSTTWPRPSGPLPARA